VEAEQLAIAANANIGVAEALRYPAFNITGLLGVASPELSDAVGGGPVWWSTGANLLSPIFYFGQNKRRVEIERAKSLQALYDYESTVIQSFREVEDALIAIQTLKQELVAREAHVKAAVNARLLSRDRYDQGVTSYLEVLETERQAFDAELLYSENKSNLFIAYIDLYRALGGGWITPEEEALVVQQKMNDEGVNSREELDEEVTSDRNVIQRAEEKKVEKEGKKDGN
jgi:multidrug efflux system outer membrane protein